MSNDNPPLFKRAEQILRDEEEDSRGIFLKTRYVEMVGGDTLAGLLFSQILYWCRPSKKRLRIERDGYLWLAKSSTEWFEETTLTRSQSRRALEVLKEIGLIETNVWKFNTVPTTHVRLVMERFADLYDNPTARPLAISDQSNGYQRPMEGSPATNPITETTTETTNKDYSYTRTDNEAEETYEEDDGQTSDEELLSELDPGIGIAMPTIRARRTTKAPKASDTSSFIAEFDSLWAAHRALCPTGDKAEARAQAARLDTDAWSVALENSKKWLEHWEMKKKAGEGQYIMNLSNWFKKGSYLADPPVELKRGGRPNASPYSPSGNPGKGNTPPAPQEGRLGLVESSEGKYVLEQEFPNEVDNFGFPYGNVELLKYGIVTEDEAHKLEWQGRYQWKNRTHEEKLFVDEILLRVKAWKAKRIAERYGNETLANDKQTEDNNSQMSD